MPTKYFNKMFNETVNIPPELLQRPPIHSILTATGKD